MRRTGLAQYLKKVFSRELIDYRKGSGESKRFRPIAQSVGFSDAEAIENIIAVGDGMIDLAWDLDGLVSIIDGSVYRSEGYINPKIPIKALDSSIIKEVINEVARSGPGFNRGFKQLYGRSEPSEYAQRTHDSGNGVRFGLVYSLPEWRGMGVTTTIPIVFDITGAEKELQPI